MDLLKTARRRAAAGVVAASAAGSPWLPWAGRRPRRCCSGRGRLLDARRVPAAAQSRRPPEQWALQELGRLDESATADAAAYHTALSDVVRRYLADRFGLPATRQTTAEFLETVRRSGRLSAEQQALLRDFLERCDLAKFAPVGASAGGAPGGRRPGPKLSSSRRPARKLLDMSA